MPTDRKQFLINQRSKPRRFQARRSGGAVIEMVLCMSVLTTLCFGMVEFGYYFWVKNIFEGAARDGMRAAVVWNTTNVAVTTAVTNAIQPTGLSTTTPLYTVAITDTSGNPVANVGTVTSGTYFEVSISATWGTIGAGFRPLQLIGAGKVLSATCVMMKEY